MLTVTPTPKKIEQAAAKAAEPSIPKSLRKALAMREIIFCGIEK